MTTKLVIFDKDGTLVEGDIWDEITGRMLDEFVPAGRRQDAADSLGFDLAARAVRLDAPIMGESNGATIDRMFSFVDATIVHADDHSAYANAVNDRCAEWILDEVIEMNGATVLLDALIGQGVALAVCTNDSERSARNQLDRLGWAGRLPLLYGYDSGHGEKPDPGMLRAAASTYGIVPADALMVGDSFADLGAAEAAGIRSVYIGTDPTQAANADHHITHLSQVVDLLDG